VHIRSGSGIWNAVDKLPIWGVTSTNGDGGLVQATLEAVDGSRLGGFFVQVVPLGDCSGKKILYAVVDTRMHLNLYGWLHVVRGCTEMRDEVGTAMRPWNVENSVNPFSTRRLHTA